MARETIVRLTDDLDGSEAQETVKFGLDGKNYVIDLTDENAEILRERLAVYVEHGQVDRGNGRATSVSQATLIRQPAAQRSDPARTAAIREWAQDQGYTISDRGRIKREIVEAYDAAVA